MMNVDLLAIVARAQAAQQARTANANIAANSDPHYDLANNTVTKSHALSRAYYRFGLVEKRCMEALISKLHPLRTDNPIQEIELSAVQYAKTYSVPTNDAYRDLSNAVHALMHRVITADRPVGKKGRIEFTVMIKAEYKEDEGKISCAFNPLIVPYLLGLREKFSSYPLRQAVNFSSSYTWRFYELLVSWAQPKKDTGERFMGWIEKQSVDELREMIGVPDSYKWVHFSAMLEGVITELKEKANIAVFIKRIKTVRKITHLTIQFIEDKPTEAANTTAQPRKSRTR